MSFSASLLTCRLQLFDPHLSYFSLEFLGLSALNSPPPSSDTATGQQLPLPLPPIRRGGGKVAPGKTWNSTAISAPTLLQPIFAPLAYLVQLVVDDKGAAGDTEEADEKTRQEDDAHQLATSIRSRAAFK